MFSSTVLDTCVVWTPLGLSSDQGVVFTGSNEMVPIVPPAPFIGLHPIVNQPLYYTFTSSSVLGMYMQFYSNVRAKIKPFPDIVNGAWQYTLTQGPDFVLKNLAGKSQPMNPEALAFSPNGDWMIVDFPFQGFVRVNLATFEEVPFAQSMNNGNDYANYTAQLAISNDGRYAAIKPSNHQEFKVYDISTCKGTTLPFQGSTCQARDYWPDLNAQFSGLKAVYQPRFTSDMQLSLTAQYAYTAGQFKAAQYTLTAPGEDPSGIGYLGMGDSYASGQGAFNYIAGTDTSNNSCHLSSLSYPFLITSTLFNSGHSVACSGATTSDINGNPHAYQGQNTPPRTRQDLIDLQLLDPILTGYSPGYILQSDFVQKYNPNIITLSIGGNDIGFEDIVTRCVTPAVIHTTCYSTKEDQQELINRIESQKNKLQNTYHSISSPTRRVYVIGYPQIVVSGGNCANNVHLNAQEIKLFIDLTDTLNNVVQQAAAAAGVQYVDVSDAFAGHRMCETKSSDIAVNGLTAGNDKGAGPIKFIGAESYHPNVLGHELLKRAILNKTNNLKTYVKSAPPAQAAPTLPYPDAPNSGRTINLTTTENALAPDVAVPLAPFTLHVDSSTAQLKSSSSYSVRLDDNPANVGSATTDAMGNLTGSASLPANVTCGHHTLHLFGANMLGEPTDIYKEIYAAPETGCSDPNAQCGVVADSGVDVDKDGTDDACDPLIAEPPAQTGYTVYLTGSSIHATKDESLAGSSDAAIDSNNASLTKPAEGSSTMQEARGSYLVLLGVVLFGLLGGWLYRRAGKYA